MADTRVPLIPQAPEGLSPRARYFVEGHGLRVPRRDLSVWREAWLEHGVPPAEIVRAVAFQERWGGIALPPAPAYEGGPRVLEAGVPEGSAASGWRFSAGGCRVSMAHGFMIGPEGESGIDADRWTPLHASTEGWVEALALADHASQWAKTITKIKGGAVEELDLEGFEPVPEVQGLADTWWRGKDSLIAVYRGDWALTPLTASGPTSTADSTRGAWAALDHRWPSSSVAPLSVRVGLVTAADVSLLGEPPDLVGPGRRGDQQGRRGADPGPATMAGGTPSGGTHQPSPMS